MIAASLLKFLPVQAQHIFLQLPLYGVRQIVNVRIVGVEGGAVDLCHLAKLRDPDLAKLLLLQQPDKRALTLGVGMCMVMVWEGLMIWGIVVGLIGIVLLLCLIPVCVGLK